MYNNLILTIQKPLMKQRETFLIYQQMLFIIICETIDKIKRKEVEKLLFVIYRNIQNIYLYVIVCYKEFLWIVYLKSLKKHA